MLWNCVLHNNRCSLAVRWWLGLEQWPGVGGLGLRGQATLPGQTRWSRQREALRQHPPVSAHVRVVKQRPWQVTRSVSICPEAWHPFITSFSLCKAVGLCNFVQFWAHSSFISLILIKRFNSTWYLFLLFYLYPWMCILSVILVFLIPLNSIYVFIIIIIW